MARRGQGRARHATYRRWAIWAVLASSIIGAGAQARPMLPDFTTLVEEASPAVVNISTHRTAMRDDFELPLLPDDHPLQPFLDRYGAPERRWESQPHDTESLGSGFITSPDGYVLTNYHVVGDADEIIVRLSDRREFVAELVGYDDSGDLALLKIDSQDLPVVRMGDSSELRVGEWVLAIGAPFGFEHSVTAGIVSAKGRSLPYGNYVPFIQTDVAINPGNSGGPLFNLAGEVVGINSHIYSRTGGFMGVSFAIPIELALDVAEQLRLTGHVTRGWLGVLIQDITRDLAESFGMRRPVGALVSEVVPESPAAAAGIRVGDIILRFRGHEISVSAGLPPLVGRTSVGDLVELDILRDGKEHTIAVTIGELPAVAATPRPEQQVVPQLPDGRIERLGIIAESVPDDERELLGLDQGGVRVLEVERGGPAQLAGVLPGDIIGMFDQRTVERWETLARIVEGLPTGRSVPMLVHRDGNARFIALRLP